jgi:Ca-activated chloride channel family protein
VFLVDVSGSMEESDKLPLVRNALKMLTTQLRPEDHVSLVTYADGSGVLLPPTSGADKADILAAIDRLQAAGGTNGGAGIDLAYAQARAGFIHGGVNRILLATDGDFNVGTTNMDQLKAMITQNRRSGIALSTLGVGQGNYQEPVMQQLADVGNGNYAYLDSLDEARKVLLEQMGSTLQTVAADVKLQMEFNPQQVAAWRLIGYEKRLLNEQDFRNDHVDAGEVGAGKSVVALYELTPTAGAHRYSFWPFAGRDSELGYLKIRYKSPDHKQVHEVQRPLRRSDYGKPGADWRFAAAVAGFGEHLRGDPEVQGWGWDQVRRLAKQGVGRDESGYRQDFLHMVDMAAALQASTPTVSQADAPDQYPD